MVSKVINDIIDNNVSQCGQRFHEFVVTSSENHLFNSTKKEQNACSLCEDSNPALHTAKK